MVATSFASSLNMMNKIYQALDTHTIFVSIQSLLVWSFYEICWPYRYYRLYSLSRWQMVQTFIWRDPPWSSCLGPWFTFFGTGVIEWWAALTGAASELLVEIPPETVVTSAEVRCSTGGPAGVVCPRTGTGLAVVVLFLSLTVEKCTRQNRKTFWNAKYSLTERGVS